jgi:hypothetical protein
LPSRLLARFDITVKPTVSEINFTDSKRDGVRQLYVMRLSDRKESRITDLKKGHAAMWASWQPRR